MTEYSINVCLLWMVNNIPWVNTLIYAVHDYGFNYWKGWFFFFLSDQTPAQWIPGAIYPWVQSSCLAFTSMQCWRLQENGTSPPLLQMSFLTSYVPPTLPSLFLKILFTNEISWLGKSRWWSKWHKVFGTSF